MLKQTPEIIIEGYEKDPALLRITPDGIMEVFQDTVCCVENYFDIHLPSGMVSTICFRPTAETKPAEKSYPDDLENVVGYWFPDTKRIEVYTDKLIYDDGYSGVLRHETGHGILDAILREARPAYTSADEAFAEWVEVIAAAPGRPDWVWLRMQQDRQALKTSLPDEPELLFHTALTKPYPHHLVQMKDASILYYIYSNGHNLDELLSIVSL